MWEFEEPSQKSLDSDFTERRFAQTAKQPRQLRPNSQPIPLSPDQRRRSRSQKSARSSVAPKPSQSNVSGFTRGSGDELRQRSNRRDRRLEVVPLPNSKATRRRRLEKKAIELAPRIEKPIAIPRPQTRSGRAFLYGTRLLILGVGIGVIAGTILSVWDPAGRSIAEVQAEKTEQPAPIETQPALPQLTLSQEIVPLKTQIEAAIAPFRGTEVSPAPTSSSSATPAPTQMTPGFMIVDLDTQSYVDINGSTQLPAASTIKFPLLVAFFQDVDAGKIRLDQKLTMRKELIATEAGDMQFLPPGTQFPALEVATKMITVSDNTATNMIIDLLGGAEAVSQRFQSWGLTQTTIRNLLPDLRGTNTSSARDMVTLLGLVNSGKLMSFRASDRMLSIMRQVHNNSLIPQGLGEGALIAHKTGDIGSMLGDVGLVDMPNGKRYLIAAMVQRPHNDDRAGELIRQVSQLTYRYFSQSTAPSSPAPTAAPASPAPTNESQGAEPQQRMNIAQP